MATVGVASVVLNVAKSKEFQTGLQVAKQAFVKLGQAILNMTKSIMQAFANMAKSVVNFGKSCLETAGQFQRLQTTLNSRIGREAGGELFDNLRRMSGTYGIPLEQLNQATHTLLDFGYQAEQVPDMLYLISSAAAQAGGDVNSATQTIANLLGRLQMGLPVMARQLIQLQTHGINVFPILAQQLGVAEQQVYGMVSRLDPQQIVGAIMESMRQSSQALIEQGNTYEAQVNRMNMAMLEIKDTIGRFLLPYMVQVVKYITAAIQVAVDYLNQHGGEIRAWLQNLVNQITPFLFRLGGLLTGVFNIIKNMAPALQLVADAFVVIYDICVGIAAYVANIVYSWKVLIDLFAKIPENKLDIRKWAQSAKEAIDDIVDFNREEIAPKFIGFNPDIREAMNAGESWGGSWLQGAMSSFGNINDMITQRMAENDAALNTPPTLSNLPALNMARQDNDATLKLYEELFKKIDETKNKYMDNIKKLGVNAWTMALTGGLNAEMLSTYNTVMNNQNDNQRQLDLLQQIANNTSSMENISDFNSLHAIPIEGY